MSNSSTFLELEHAERLERDVAYLSATRYPFWLRNASDYVIHVRSASVKLQGEDTSVAGAEALVNRRDGLPLRLEPGSRASVQVGLFPPLLAQPGSNSLTVSVEFETLSDRGVGTPRSLLRPQFDYIILGRAPSHPAAEVFVSFVDPENERIADVAAMYLDRAGIRPYLAKRDTRTGCDYWEEKIYPAIERSAGVLVIWTPDTFRRPESVIREIAHAKKRNIPVGLFRSAGAQLPGEYPKNIKEYASFDPAAPRQAFAEGIAAGFLHWAATGRFFD